jgi:hypothetical protein
MRFGALENCASAQSPEGVQDLHGQKVLDVLEEWGSVPGEHCYKLLYAQELNRTSQPE